MWLIRSLDTNKFIVNESLNLYKSYVSKISILNISYMGEALLYIQCLSEHVGQDFSVNMSG